MGVISVITMIHIVDLILFVSMIVFFHLGDPYMVKAVLVFQLLFNIALSILVVSFFILWIYVSRKFLEWKGMHSHERYIILTKKLFFVACFFVCLIILKALANIFLTTYVSLCGPICVNVQIILNSCTCSVGDLIPLLSLYYTFWFFDKPKKKEGENNNLLIPVPKNNTETALRTLHNTSLSSLPVDVQLIDDYEE
ncbi:predicted protein [Naegleria gruberi]|uniref:Predicted protein n=1 Tax=Naegleria gruberi TaxID=5762 RepID=D2VWG6_NAEGR|nr:uncharacterized protein NAEGRDRAFT_73373 [Naegleria gruberi]EFC38834.1 predicted protein [Naegleria gruberi]|eukprot:XP_002671578.1 predicted protein [Naegleria gruberi strain NEG-M]